MSADGTIALAQLDIRNSRDFNELTEVGEDIIEQGDEIVAVDGVQVEYGGDFFA